MAAGWTKLRDDLPDDVRVNAIAEGLGLDVDAVIGKLFRLWSWARTNAPEGVAGGLTAGWLDRKLGCPGFAAALESVGWLKSGPDGLTLPKIERYNASPAVKRREQTKERVRRHRERKAGGVTRNAECNALQMRYAPVTEALPVTPSLEGDLEKESRGMNSPGTPSCPEPPPATSGPPADAPPTPEPCQAQPKAGKAPKAKKAKKADPLDAGPPVLTFPVVGPDAGDAGEWALTQARIDRLAAAYPGVDALAEARKAQAWAEANPRRRKTPGGMPEFLRRWFDTAQNDAARRGRVPPARASPGGRPGMPSLDEINAMIAAKAERR